MVQDPIHLTRNVILDVLLFNHSLPILLKIYFDLLAQLCQKNPFSGMYPNMFPDHL